MADLYLALIHYPVYNKAGKTVATSITPLDLHDLARSCVTYGVKRCYVVNPLPIQRKVARRITAYWQGGMGGDYNPTRQEAFRVVAVTETLEEAVADITAQSGPPALIGTTARRRPGMVGYDQLATQIRAGEQDHLLLFGTGWGMTHELLDSCAAVLEPIEGPTAYNHLSVRGAVSIILDRLCARGPLGETTEHAHTTATLSEPRRR